MRINRLFTPLAILLMCICFNSYAHSSRPSAKVQQDTLQPVIIFTGYVTDWLVNTTENKFDGFSLQTKSEKLMVKFPIHMANLLRKSIKIGKTIAVNGIVEKDSMGVKRINLINVIIDGETIQDNPPITAGTNLTNEIIYGKAKIREFQKNVEGKITGYILDNKTILRLTPNTSQELDKLLVVGASISYSGTKSYAGSGEDAWSTYTIILCQLITINGKQYLTK